MRLDQKIVVLTGATGGIGRPLALALAERGANLALTGRDIEKLRKLKYALKLQNRRCIVIEAELATAEGRRKVFEETRRRVGAPDILINNAGSSQLALFHRQAPEAIERIFHTNLTAPVLLAREVLPEMLERGSGQIVNIGSAFGSLGFGCFASYCGSKFGLRGFSEALRRELHGTGVTVTYIAPRGTRTGFNPDGLYALSKKIGFRFDAPEKVARAVVKAVEKNKREVYIGFPEKLFGRINALSPRRIDGGTRKPIRLLKEYLDSNPSS